MKHRKSILKKLCVVSMVIVCAFSSLTVHAARATQSEAARRDRVYVGNYREIWAVNMQTGNAGLVRKTSGKATEDFNDLQRNKNFIYYDGGEPKSSSEGIYRYDLDKNKEYRLGDGQSPIVYKNKIYYVSFAKKNGKKVISGISRMNLNGGSKKLLVSSSETNMKFTVFAGKVYYIAADNKTLCSSDLQGKTKNKLAVLDTKKAIYMTADSKSVYIKCNYNNRKLYYQYNTKTKKVKALANAPSIRRIYGFDGNYFYDYTSSYLYLNDFVHEDFNNVLESAGDRGFEKIIAFNSNYIVCETSYYGDGYTHTLSILNRGTEGYTDIIPKL